MNFMSETGNEKKKIINEKTIMKLLDTLYQKSKDGIPFISSSVEELADDYLKKDPDSTVGAKKMIRNQVAKCTTSGAITGLGGVITLPVSIPANISSVLYIQMRMIACTAYMAGYDLSSDQVQTFVYACLAGVSVNALAKKVGVKAGEKFAGKAIEKIPRAAITKINQKVGFRFLTKFGETGVINLGKLIPGVGAIVNGGFDLAETRIIGNRAYRMFIEGDFSDEKKMTVKERTVKVVSDIRDGIADIDVVEIKDKTLSKLDMLKDRIKSGKKDASVEEEFVYISAKGKTYHVIEKEAGNNPIRVTRQEAEEAGYTPCKRCASKFLEV